MSLIETLTQVSAEIYSGDISVQKLESMGGGASGADAYSILDKQGKHIGFVKIVRNKFNKGMSEFKNHELLMQKWNESNINPRNSLFPIHAIRYFDKKTIFMVMDNILSDLSTKTSELQSLFFDIKGNPGNRKIKDDYLFIALGLSLNFKELSRVYKQFLKDTQWLAGHGIMDYSMTIAAPAEALLLISENLKGSASTAFYAHVHKLLHKNASSMKVEDNSISVQPWSPEDLSLCIDLNYPTPFLDMTMKDELKRRYESGEYALSELREFYKSIPKFVPVLDMSYKNPTNVHCRSKFHIIDPSQQFVMIKKFQEKKKKNKKCSKCQRKSVLLNNCSVCGDSSCDPESYRKRFIHFFQSITCKNAQLIRCPELCETKTKQSKKNQTRKRKRKRKAKRKKSKRGE
tara:strand:- start:172 stop:1380 length:1209 start_codon:yes stop_codon:yes gene_type:complete